MLAVKIIAFFILVVFIVGTTKREGFIDFNHSVGPNRFIPLIPSGTGTGTETVPNLQKLFDNLYYHVESGTLIELKGAAVDLSTCVAPSGSSPSSVQNVLTMNNNVLELNPAITQIRAKLHTGNELNVYGPSNVASFLEMIRTKTLVMDDTVEYQFYVTTESSTSIYAVFILIHRNFKIIHITKKLDSLICATFFFQEGNNSYYIPSGIVSIPACNSPDDSSGSDTAITTRQDARQEVRQDARQEARKDASLSRPQSDQEPFALFNQNSIRLNSYDNPVVQIGPFDDMGFDPIRMNIVYANSQGVLQFRDRYGQFLTDKTHTTTRPPSGINVAVYSWELEVSNVYMMHIIAVPNFTYILVMEIGNPTNHYVYEFNKDYTFETESTTTSSTTSSTDPLPDPVTVANENTITTTNTNTIDNPINTAGTAANTAINTAGNAANTAINTAGNAANTVVDTAGNAVNQAVDGASNVANVAMLSTGAVAIQAIDKAEQSLNVIATTSGNVVEKTVDTAGNTIVSTVDTAGNTITKTIDTAGNTITNTVDTAGNTISSTVDTAGSVLTGASNNLAGVANNAIHSFESIINTSVGGILNTINQAIRGFFNILENEKSTIDTNTPLFPEPAAAAATPPNTSSTMKHPYIVYPNSNFRVQPMPASYAAYAAYSYA